MKNGIMTMTVLYSDFMIVPELTAKFNSLLRKGNVQIIECNARNMKVRSNESILRELFK